MARPETPQFLGMGEDPRNNRPIILMELMEQNLTDFVERSSTGVPYHVQVNISHDIALAVYHLHWNGIIHRDLSTHNILLTTHYQAKVTGFWKSKMVDSDPSLPRPMTPPIGDELFLPPEALCSEPCYSDKSDCFSIGLLLLYIATKSVGVVSDVSRKSYLELITTFQGFLPVVSKTVRTDHQLPSSARDWSN